MADDQRLTEEMRTEDDTDQRQDYGETNEVPMEEYGNQPPPPPGTEGGLMDYDSAVELTGRGRFSYRVLGACCVIFNYSIIEMAAIAYIITPAECDLNMSIAQKSSIGSAVYAGIIATSILWGELSDRFGRRKVMLPSLIATIVASFFSSLCTSFWPLFIFRFIAGCTVSAPSAVVFVYLGELQASEFRDVSIAIAVTSAQAMFVILPAIAWIIVPHTWSFNLIVLIRPWRLFMWTWGFIGLIGVVQLLTLPESPSFLMIKKGSAAALPILAKMYAENKKKTPDQFPVPGLIEKREHKSSIKADFVQLIKQPMLKCYLITHYCMFIVFFFANGLYMWLPDFINETLKNAGGKLSICKLINMKYLKIEEYSEYSDDFDEQFPRLAEYLTTNVTAFFYDEVEEQSDDCAEGEVNKFLYPMSMVMEFITLIPFLLVNVYIHKLNKTKIYGVIILANSVFVFLAAVIPQLSVATILFILGLCSGGACSILSALAVDAFPISLRSLAMCTMYTAGHLGAIVGNLIIALMVHAWCYVIFILISLFSIGVIILANSVFVFLAAVIPQLSVATILFILGLCSGGACSILSALAVDAFPISLRSLAMCTMYTAGHLGAIVGNLIIALMVHAWCYVIFILISLFSIGSAVVLYLLWPNLKQVRAEMEAREFTY